MRVPLLFLVALAGCAVLPPTYDLSDRPLPEAVGEAIDILEVDYAFTEHKDLDWAAARSALVPAAEAADGSAEAEDEVVRRLVPWLPDAHVVLEHDDPDRQLCPAAQGTRGLTLVDLDDGEVLVAAVLPGGPADEAGVRAGDVLVEVAGHPVAVARKEVPLHCHPVGAATHARVAQLQLRLLGRAPVDDRTTLSVSRDGVPLQVDVAARADGLPASEALGIQAPDRLVERRMLDGGVGYLQIGWEETLLTEVRVQRALVWLANQGATALVIDLRHNDGGMERTAANIAGYFTDERQFYETVLFYDRRTGDPTPMSDVWIEPQEVRWRHPVAVLVDAETVSSGEGLAMALQRLDGVTVVGFEGTAASFGSTGSRIRLPGGWTLHFPGGMSLDADGRIQLDSDDSGVGGVSPDVVVPSTRETRLAWGAGEDVVLQAAIDLLGGAR